MPISKDRFEEMGDKEGNPAPKTNAARILDFLRAHPAKAFTEREIAAKAEVKSGFVGPTLVRLREQGRVDHHGTYWRVSDHDRSLDASTGHAAAVLADRETDEETPTMADWQEHAVDPRTTRDES
ncbi:MarR family transcriptional regulator [Haloarcula laminariae]|uniref:MarR family transcriptional regulator n=1 Tax=Haloarcula laminariae TaxID=2961577 RepID=UPI002405C37E|nr:MarR family transcriptional regulator [Halomicroarcula sp. FL173]